MSCSSKGFFFSISIEDFCDKFAKVVKENLRKTLTKLADGEKKEVMLYFIGHTKMVYEL